MEIGKEWLKWLNSEVLIEFKQILGNNNIKTFKYILIKLFSMDYTKMLKKAKEELPEQVNIAHRFEIPKVRGHIQGNKTIISNFMQIASTLRRKHEHLLKFILRELATPGEIRRNLVIFGRKLSASQINEKIYKYVQEFVLCKECGKPDTKLTREGSFTYLKCQACGAKYIVKSKI